MAQADEAPNSVPPSAVGAPAVRGAGLGRLAQSARGGELKNARGILLFVGIMSVLVNAFFFATAAGDVQQEIDKELTKLQASQPGFQADPFKIEALKVTAIRTTHLVTGGGLVLGLVFVGCALLVNTYPVPATVAGLILYLGGTAVFGLLNPASLMAGIIVKVIIVLGLFKAVQAAIAYQKDVTGGA